MLTITLLNAGFRVTALEDGAAALESAREINFDLVTSGLRMPRMDGTRSKKEPRKFPALIGIPLFLLATEAAAARKKAGGDTGAGGWIEEPVAADPLLALVSEMPGWEAGRVDAAGNTDGIENDAPRI